jgi:hypothetical protein
MTVNKTAQAVDPQIASYLARALSTAVANASAKVGPIKSSFAPYTHMEGERFIVIADFNPPLSDPQREAVSGNFTAYLQANNPQLASKVVLQFSQSGKTAMDNKTATLKLLAVVKKQQAMIEKLAQSAPVHPAAQTPAPQHMDPVNPSKREAETILNALSANVRALIANLEVHPGAGGKEVKVFAKPGQPDHALDVVQRAVQNTVASLAQKNMLPPPAAYKVQVQG